MHIHVNLDYIATTLANNIDEEGKISLYAFLSQLMKGISDATGQINTFELIYDDLTNYFYIIDSNTLPGAGEYLGKNTIPTRLNVNLLNVNEGSFVKEVSIKSELDNKFAATISIGAQANGNKVGENATALSKLNVGYEDRILKEKSSIIDSSTEDTTTTDGSGSISPQQAYANNLAQYAGLINKLQLGTITPDDITSGTDAVVDLFKYQLGYYTQQGNIGGVGFIPINLQLSMKGLSGPRIYESYTINDEILPDNYRNNIQFIAKGVSHKISDNDWVTTLESLSGPRQSSLKPLGSENFITGDGGTGGNYQPNPDNNKPVVNENATPTENSIIEATPTNPGAWIIVNGDKRIDSAYKLRAHHSEKQNWQADPNNIRSGGWTRTFGSNTKGAAAYVYDLVLYRDEGNGVTNRPSVPSPVNGKIVQLNRVKDSYITIEEETTKEWYRLLHMDNFTVGVGDTVTRGQLIGKQSDIMTGKNKNGKPFKKNVHLHVEFPNGGVLINYIHELFNNTF